MRSGFAKGSTSSPPCGEIRCCFKVQNLPAPRLATWNKQRSEIESQGFLETARWLGGVRGSEKS